MKVVKGVNPKNPHHKEFFFLLLFLLYLYEMLTKLYRSNHVTKYIIQTITLYNVGLYSDICQLNLNKIN